MLNSEQFWHFLRISRSTAPGFWGAGWPELSVDSKTGSVFGRHWTKDSQAGRLRLNVSVGAIRLVLPRPVSPAVQSSPKQLRRCPNALQVLLFRDDQRLFEAATVQLGPAQKRPVMAVSAGRSAT